MFPTTCPVCRQEFTRAGWATLCDECWKRLEPWTGPACSRCGLPFASELAAASTEPLCADCRREEFHFDLARSFGLYKGDLRTVILQLKFLSRRRLGLQLGRLLAPLWVTIRGSNGNELPLLVPVPLHQTRERARGFNQAEVLARGLSAEVSSLCGKKSLRVAARCLERTRLTVPQAGLSLGQRHENVRGIFRVPSPESVRGRTVVLVDDVMTTGATLSSCALSLKRAGADRVYGLTLARATPMFPDVVAVRPLDPVDDLGQARG
jgi:ComF family protein